MLIYRNTRNETWRHSIGCLRLYAGLVGECVFSMHTAQCCTRSRGDRKLAFNIHSDRRAAICCCVAACGGHANSYMSRVSWVCHSTIYYFFFPYFRNCTKHQPPAIYRIQRMHKTRVSGSLWEHTGRREADAVIHLASLNNSLVVTMAIRASHTQSFVVVLFCFWIHTWDHLYLSIAVVR